MAVFRVKDRREDLCGIGERLAREGKHDEAIKVFENALSVDVNYAKAALGAAESRMEKLQKVLIPFRSVAKIRKREEFSALREVADEDVSYFGPEVFKLCQHSMNDYLLVKRLVETGQDTSKLLGSRPDIVKECDGKVAELQRISKELYSAQ